MTREEYEAKRQARYERLKAAAERAEREGNALTDEAHKMASVIPFGQPVLVGHYSEGPDRRYRARIENKYRRGYELRQKSCELAERAEAAARNDAISSDDPDAVSKLEEKLAQLQALQEGYKAANKLIKGAGDLTQQPVRLGVMRQLQEMGFSEHMSAQVTTPDYMGRLGFPPYHLQNNNSNMARIRARIEGLKAKPTESTSTEGPGGVKVIHNADLNRIQIIFPGKPEESVRDVLKYYGFRWAPSEGAWQRHLNNAGIHAAECVSRKLNELANPSSTR